MSRLISELRPSMVAQAPSASTTNGFTCPSLPRLWSGGDQIKWQLETWSVVLPPQYYPGRPLLRSLAPQLHSMLSPYISFSIGDAALVELDFEGIAIVR